MTTTNARKSTRSRSRRMRRPGRNLTNPSGKRSKKNRQGRQLSKLFAVREAAVLWARAVDLNTVPQPANQRCTITKFAIESHFRNRGNEMKPLLDAVKPRCVNAIIDIL